MDVQEKAEQDAVNELLSYGNKSVEFIIEKYVSFQNQKTLILNQIEYSKTLTNDDSYTYHYCSIMEKELSFLLANETLKEHGYIKDKNNVWKKKKKGFFS